MRFLLPVLLCFTFQEIRAADPIIFDSLTQVQPLYAEFRGTPNEQAFFKSAYNFIFDRYRGGKQKEAYETIASMVNEIEERDNLYWKVEFVRARSTMAIGLDDDAQVQKDLEYLQGIAERTKVDSVRAVINFTVGQTYKSQRKFDLAINFYRAAIDDYRAIGNYRTMIMAMVFMSACYDYQYDSKTAISLYQEAIAESELRFADDPSVRDDMLYRAYIGLGNVLQKTREFELSSKYYAKTLALPAKSDNYRATTLTNLATNATYQEDFPVAIKYLKEVLALPGISQSKRKIALNSIVRTYHNFEQPDSVAVYLEQFAALAGKPENSRYSSYLTRLGDYQFSIGEHANAKETYTAAYHYLQAHEPQKLNSVRYVLDGICRANLGRSGQDSSLFYYDLLVAQIDTINKKDNENEILTASVKYETELKEAENLRLQQSVILRNMWLGIGGFGIVALSFLGFIWNKNLRLTRENNRLLGRENDQLAREKAELQKLNDDLSIRVAELVIVADPEAKVLISSGTKQSLVPLHEVMYVLAEHDGATYVMTENRRRSSSQLFRDASSSLPEEIFFETKRGYLINLSFIDYVNKTTVKMTDGTHIPLTKKNRTALGKRLAEKKS